MSDKSPGDAHICYGMYLNLDEDGKSIMRAVLKQMLENARLRKLTKGDKE